MKHIWKFLIYDDDGKISRSAFVGIVGFFTVLGAALLCTGYVVIKGVKFDGYDQFLSFCATVIMYCMGLLLGRAGLNAVSYNRCSKEGERYAQTTPSEQSSLGREKERKREPLIAE